VPQCCINLLTVATACFHATGASSQHLHTYNNAASWDCRCYSVHAMGISAVTTVIQVSLNGARRDSVGALEQQKPAKNSYSAVSCTHSKHIMFITHRRCMSRASVTIVLMLTCRAYTLILQWQATVIPAVGSANVAVAAECQFG
jgi:hypothetical protein